MQRNVARVEKPWKSQEQGFLHVGTISEPSNNWRPLAISGRRTISGPFFAILFFLTKKNKMENFPTKMKRKIGAPKGR